MKKKLFVCLASLLLLLALCAAASAAGAGPLKYEMHLSATSFTEPKSITVGIQVTNISDTDMSGPVTLYYPNGKQVEDFGSPTLAAGKSKSWSGTWKVTQAQLEAGKISFSVKYSVYNEEGQLLNKTNFFSRAITYDGVVTSVKVNRSISPTMAEKGQEITIVYEIVNTGNTNITDVTIKEDASISSKTGHIDAVGVGEKKTVTFKTTMGSKNLTSKAKVTYKVGSKSYSVNKEAVTIQHGTVNLKATLTADRKGVLAGEAVKMTLTLKNTGKKDITGITITDADGVEFKSGLTVKAGETTAFDIERTINSTQDFLFNVTGAEENGAALSTATGSVTVTAMNPEDVIAMSVTAEADRDTVYTLPGTVKFTVHVTNESQTAINDVKVYATGVQLYSFPTIEVGETRSFTRDIDVSMGGQFQFEARANDKLSQTQSFTSNILRINYARPTPVPTEAPIVTPPAPIYEPIPEVDDLPEYLDEVDRALEIAFWVCGGIAALCLFLLLIGLIGRMRRASFEKSDAVKSVLNSSVKTVWEGKPAHGKRRMIETPASSAQETGDGDEMRSALERVYAERSEAQTPDNEATVDANAEAEQSGSDKADS